MKGFFICTCVLIILLLTSCGSFTKMRYSRGFKSNIEFNLSKKAGKAENLTRAKAVKNQDGKLIINVKKEVLTTIILPEKAETMPIKVEPEDKGKPLFKDLKLNNIQFLPKVHNKTNNPPFAAADRRIEKNSLRAGLLFYSGILLFILSLTNQFYTFLLSVISIGSVGLALNLIFLLCDLMLIAGYIFAITGLRKIKKSAEQYSGKGLDKSIIVIFSLMLLIPLLGLIWIISQLQ